MKTLKFFILISFLIGTVIIFSSCEADPCDGVVCQNNAPCVDGVCNCPDGYQGTFCETEWREKLVGTFTLRQECSTGFFGPFKFNITKDANDPLELDANSPGSVPRYRIVMTGETTFVLPKQKIRPELPVLEGSGSINENTGDITLSFEYTDGVTCTYRITPD